MLFNLVTLFPDFFASPLETGLLGRARKAGIINYNFYNPRDYSNNPHRQVDDAPYGGGPGMVMQPGPLARAIRAINSPGKMIYLSPRGTPLTAALSRQLAQAESLTLVCGRYEGIDQRLLDIFPIREVAVGEAILNGGETAALAIIESVARFLPGFMGKAESGEDETFAHGLLEYPQYTRPEVFEGHSVPEILRNGHHAHIARWRREQALALTLRQRPGLLESAQLDRDDAHVLAGFPRLRPGRNLCFALLHYPVVLENNRVGTSSLTNLDIHDIARISCSYGMGAFFVLTPIAEQRHLLDRLLLHWQSGKETDRQKALALVRPVADWNELDRTATDMYGVKPMYVAASAQWPRGKKAPPPLAPPDIASILRRQPVIICLGTARGLAREFLAKCDGQLRPLRFLNENHLSVRSAAAILADRILGDYL